MIGWQATDSPIESILSTDTVSTTGTQAYAQTGGRLAACSDSPAASDRHAPSPGRPSFEDDRELRRHPPFTPGPRPLAAAAVISK